MKSTLYVMDVLQGLSKIEDNTIDCCITSPPYYGLRDYGTEGQIGQEDSPEAFISRLVEVFGQVKRVLKKDGTLWLNIGDSYCGTGDKGNHRDPKYGSGRNGQSVSKTKMIEGIKRKDLIGIPWMLAFALRADGWYLRQDIIWHKKNCMPEPAKDRCVKNHEYIFLMSKSPKYHFDYMAIMEEAVWDVDGTGTIKRKERQFEGSKSEPKGIHNGIRKVYRDGKTGNAVKSVNGMRNKRSVWSYPTAQFAQAHFATFPQVLITDCIKAGCLKDGIVLDPFAGAGTTLLVANKLGRNAVGIEISEDYANNILAPRLRNELGMFLDLEII